MKILLIPGSNSTKSVNKMLLMAVAGLIPDIEHSTLDLNDYPIPMFSTGHQQALGVPEHAKKLKELIDAADALIISVPEHNGSIPAFFKNVLDWLSRVEPDYKILGNKPVLILSATPGKGGGTAIGHAEIILTRLGAVISGKVVVRSFYEQTGNVDGAVIIKNKDLHETLSNAVSNLVHHIKTIKNGK